MIVVDTTVLVYAVGSAHPLRNPCRTLVEAVRDGKILASTTPEVIQEFAHVRARRRSRRDASETARSFAQLFAPLVGVGADDLGAGLDLFEEYDGLGAFDAVLAAVAERRGADAIVSADRAFARVKGVRHIDPASRQFLDELL